jgi:enoyl-CoA hydratase/carnithine racemase
MRRELREAVRHVAASGARTLLVRADGPDLCLGGDVRESLPEGRVRRDGPKQDTNKTREALRIRAISLTCCRSWWS